VREIAMPAGADPFSVRYLLRGPPGELYAIAESWFVVIRPADHGARMVPFTTKIGSLDSAAVDATGRVWLSGDGGFAIVDRTGAVTPFLPGQVAELSAGIDAMAIV